jgi:hypothetical protein
VPLLQVGDAVLLLVAQPHHLELPNAIALRSPCGTDMSRRAELAAWSAAAHLFRLLLRSSLFIFFEETLLTEPIAEPIDPGITWQPLLARGEPVVAFVVAGSAYSTPARPRSRRCGRYSPRRMNWPSEGRDWSFIKKCIQTSAF